VAYDSKAHEFVFDFYRRGWSKERALVEIRKVYAGFSGSTWDEWIKKFDWPRRRALADVQLREFEDLCRDTNKTLLFELDKIRNQLSAAISEGDIDTQTVYAYTKVAKQMAEIADQHLASGDSRRVAMGVLSLAFEKLLSGLQEVEGLAEPLKKSATAVGQLVTRISEEFGREAQA